jgi:hypothetical protein
MAMRSSVPGSSSHPARHWNERSSIWAATDEQLAAQLRQVRSIRVCRSSHCRLRCPASTQSSCRHRRAVTSQSADGCGVTGLEPAVVIPLRDDDGHPVVHRLNDFIGSVVMTVKVSSSAPAPRSFHFSPSPARAQGSLDFRAIANGCLFLASSFCHS